MEVKEIKKRVDALETRLKSLRAKAAALASKAESSSPRNMTGLKQEIGELRERLDGLERKLADRLSEKLAGSSDRDFRYRYELLKNAIAKYCERKGLDPASLKDL